MTTKPACSACACISLVETVRPQQLACVGVCGPIVLGCPWRGPTSVVLRIVHGAVVDGHVLHSVIHLLEIGGVPGSHVGGLASGLVGALRRRLVGIVGRDALA